MIPALSNLRAFVSRIWMWMGVHKIWTGIIVVAILGGGYWGYTTYAANTTATQYVVAPATRGTLTVTVSGSGQVAANQTLDLAPKASGTVTSVSVTAGQKVAAGHIIARIDATDAEKTLRDAETSLTSAKITYQQSISGHQTDTAKAEGDARSTIATTLSHLATILPDLDSALHDLSQIPGHTFQQNQAAYAAVLGNNTASTAAGTAYQTALDAYRLALAQSNTLAANPTPADVQKLIQSAYTAASATADAAARTHEVMAQVNDRLARSDTTPPSAFTTLLTTTATDSSTASSDTSSTLSAKTTLGDALATLGGGNGVSLDVQSAQLALTKAENTVADAEEALSDYAVTAPFAGTIAKVNVQRNDQSGPSTAVATLVTNEQYADLSLNEVDAAKVKNGQKASLTFDAVEGLTVPGTVAEVDQVGTVTQGVVTYDVKISFDTQDARVKPGMTVNAIITTDAKEDALIVPSSAVTTVGNRSFVQVATTNSVAPDATSTHPMRTETVDAKNVSVSRIPVEIGLTNDTQTEIVSGLEDGEFVVSRTITAKSATTPTTNTTRTTTGTSARPAGGNAVLMRGG